MTMVKTLVALATERMLLKTSGPTFLRGIEFMHAAGLAPDRLSVMMTTSHKFVLQFHSKCDIRPFAANYPNFARVLRGIVHVRAWRIKSIEFVNVAFYMRDVDNLERAIEKLGVELVLLRNCTYPGVSRGDEAVKFLSALNRRKQAVVCEYGDDRLKHRIARRSSNRVRRPSRLNDIALARLNAENERVGDRDAAAPAAPAPAPAPPPPAAAAPPVPAAAGAAAGAPAPAPPVVAIQAMPPLINPNYRDAPQQQRLPMDHNVFAMALQIVGEPIPQPQQMQIPNYEEARNAPLLGPLGALQNARAEHGPIPENAQADAAVSAVSAAAAAAAAAGAYFYANNPPPPPAQYVGLPLEDFYRLMQHRGPRHPHHLPIPAPRFRFRAQHVAVPQQQCRGQQGGPEQQQPAAAPAAAAAPQPAAEPAAPPPQQNEEELSDTDAEEEMDLEFDGDEERRQDGRAGEDGPESEQDDEEDVEEEEEEEHVEEEDDDDDDDEEEDELEAARQEDGHEQVEHIVLDQIIREAINRSPSPQVGLLR